MAELENDPWVLVVDGSFADPVGGLRPPRLLVTDALCAAWPAMRVAAPDVALKAFSDTLVEANNRESDNIINASAVMMRRRVDGSGWDIAECGDTKVFLGANAIWSGALRPDDHRLLGPLGSPEPRISHRVLKSFVGEPISILTDGAWRLLAKHRLLDPKTTQLSPNAFGRFEELKFEASDDATFVMLDSI
jgi:hypothetical protein